MRKNYDEFEKVRRIRTGLAELTYIEEFNWFNLTLRTDWEENRDQCLGLQFCSVSNENLNFFYDASKDFEKISGNLQVNGMEWLQPPGLVSNINESPITHISFRLAVCQCRILKFFFLLFSFPPNHNVRLIFIAYVLEKKRDTCVLYYKM